MKLGALAAVVGLSVTLGACASDGGNFAGGGERPGTTGDIAITTPEPGAVYDEGAPIPVSLTLTGATILEEASQDIQPDTGHVHLRLDGEIITLLGGLEMDLTELAKTPIGPGTHLLEVEFVAADHGVFSPREIESVTFTVRA